MVCLLCLSVKPWIRGEEREGAEAAGIDESVDQGNVNSTVVSECQALSLRAAGRHSTQGHASWLNANANSTEFNLECSLQKKAQSTKRIQRVNVLPCFNRHWMHRMNNELIMSRTFGSRLSKKKRGGALFHPRSTDCDPQSKVRGSAESDFVQLLFSFGSAICIWLHSVASHYQDHFVYSASVVRLSLWCLARSLEYRNSCCYGSS